MIHQKIDLPVQYRDKGIENGNFTPFLTTYILENHEEFSVGRKRPLVLICPGGGYEMLSQREAEPIALRMNALGFHACVLWYSLAPMTFPAALLDLAEAMKYVRTHAEEWNVDADRVIACGFSAGGHLAASLGVYWNKSLIRRYLPYSPEEIQPNGLLLNYPVIVAGKFAHEGSIKNVLGDTKEFTQDDVSLEKLVSADVPPVFMWHTYEDGCVPPENSLMMADALRKAGVPLELHLFRRGGHGLSLATKETAWANGEPVQAECQIWPQLFANWMESL